MGKYNRDLFDESDVVFLGGLFPGTGDKATGMALAIRDLGRLDNRTHYHL